MTFFLLPTNPTSFHWYSIEQVICHGLAVAAETVEVWYG